MTLCHILYQNILICFLVYRFSIIISHSSLTYCLYYDIKTKIYHCFLQQKYFAFFLCNTFYQYKPEILIHFAYSKRKKTSRFSLLVSFVFYSFSFTEFLIIIVQGIFTTQGSSGVICFSPSVSSFSINNFADSLPICVNGSAVVVNFGLKYDAIS